MRQRPQTPSARIRLKFLVASACILGLLPSAGRAAHSCKALYTPPGVDVALESRLGEAFNCFGENTAGTAASTVAACNDFVPRSIQWEWSLDHFWLADQTRFMTVREIEAWLPIEGSLRGWDFLGAANEADVQVSAAERAGAGQPVIAVYYNGGPPGHMALVLPGGLLPSGTYGIPVARIAQTGLNDAASSFIGCAFSFGFGKDKAAETLIYAHRGER